MNQAEKEAIAVRDIGYEFEDLVLWARVWGLSVKQVITKLYQEFGNPSTS